MVLLDMSKAFDSISHKTLLYKLQTYLLLLLLLIPLSLKSRHGELSIKYCIVLYRIVLYCTVLYCTVLYCTVLYCIVLYCILLYLLVSTRAVIGQFSGLKYILARQNLHFSPQNAPQCPTK